MLLFQTMKRIRTSLHPHPVLLCRLDRLWGGWEHLGYFSEQENVENSSVFFPNHEEIFAARSARFGG